MLRADLHIHTCYSFDCSLSPEAIVRRCLARGINCIAVTDHGTIDGALKVREIAPFPVIVGQEVYTQEGEIMGVFLKKPVPHGLPLLEAVWRIKEQGGIVGVPHPLDRLTRRNGGERLVVKLLPFLGFIEVFNARSILSGDAGHLARRYGLPGSAGSDAHTYYEIGNAFIEMPEFSSPEGFLSSLSRGKVGGRRSPIWIHFVSAGERLKRFFG